MSRYRETMSDLYKQVQENAGDYLKSKMTDTQINNIKKTWSMKTAKDVTPAIRDMIKKMDIPTQLAIKHAKINQLSKLVEEQELTEFNDAQIAKLKKEYEPMRGKTISVTNANKLGAMFTRFDSNKNALEKLYGADIPFISTMAMTRLLTKHGAKAADLNKIRKEELDLLEEAELLGEGTGKITGFRDDKEKSNMVSLAKQHSLKVKDIPGGIELSGNMRKILDMQLAVRSHLRTEEIDEGRMSDIDAMRKRGASAAEIAKELKLDVKAVKAILGEEVEEENAPSTADMDRLKKMGMKPKKEEDEEEPKKEESKDDKEKLKAELEKKDDEIAMLKTKAETEKAKTMKKETEKLVNPETGEPLLQVGIAYKHIRDKMAKEEVKEGYKTVGNEKGTEFKVYKNGKLVKTFSTYIQAHDYVKMNEEVSEMAKDKAYAIGMSTAKKKYNDEPPLEKKTIKKGHEIADKLMGMKKENTIKEYKKMTVTFNSMADMAKASTDLAKQGFTINAKGTVMKVDGKGADLNKYGTDLQNFYKAKVVAEGYTSQQIKMAYGVANDKRYKQGNYSGAVKAIEKIAKGLSSHPDVQKVLKRTNENLDEGKYTRYSDLLIQLGRMKHAKDKQGEMNTQKEIDKEKRKLGINEDHPAKEIYEQIKGLKNKAEKSGMPYSILKKVYDRGMAAWRGGHRPGTSQQQWAFARVNSFVTKSSGTWGGADKDLAKQVKGS